tara:strand:- start:503 stop:676 length:174 start_codon:yes stop_codon:yes gene_type:complete
MWEQSKKLTYQKFLREARRSLVATEYAAESNESKKISVSDRKVKAVDPNIAMKIKLD